MALDESGRDARLEGRLGFRQVWPIAWPVIAGSAAQTLLMVVDTTFVSSLGEQALGGVTMGSLIYLSIVMCAFGFGVGTQIVVARRFGEGRMRQVGRTVTHGFILQWALGLLLFATMTLLQSPLLDVMIASPNVRGIASGFLDYRFVGLFFAHTNFALRAFYVGMARPKVITLTTGIMVVVNALFDYLFIFGRFGFPALGPSGAALASVFAEAACTLTFLIFTLRHVQLKPLRLFSFRLLSTRLMRRLFRVSLPVMLQALFTTTFWLLFFVIIEHLGETALAASQLVRNVFLIVLIPVMGFASATNTLVSYLMGKRRQDEVLGLIGRIAWYCFVMVGALAVVCMAFPDWVLSLYDTTDTVKEAARTVVYVVGASSLVQSIAVMLYNGVTGSGRTGVAFAIECVTLVLYIFVAWGLAFPLHAPLWGVWLADVFYNVVMIIAAGLYLRFGNWRSALV